MPISFNPLTGDFDLTGGAAGPTGPAGPGVPTGGTANQVLAKIDATNYNTQWVTAAGSGTVTSVGLVGPTGFTVSGSPVTASGNLTFSFDTGYSLPTNASQTNWNTAFSQTRQWDGGTTGLVAATGRTSLGLGTAAQSATGDFAPSSHVGSGGTNHANVVAAGAAGFMSGADKTKLDGIATGATANSTDATLLNRANHTGQDTTAAISDFNSASRAQTEAELVAGTNITITPSGTGATRQLTLSAAGGGGGGGGDVTLSGTQTLTNKTFGNYTETVFTITDAAAFEINPNNGPIQLITLGANRTPAATTFAAGQSVTLMINDGTAFAITWTTVGVVWVGGTAPTLATTGWTVIELWKVASTIYGAWVGNVA